MVVFIANRANIQARQLHRRIRNRLRSDGYFETVQLRVADAREPGPYRVTAETNPQLFLDDSSYPVSTARLEVGFDSSTDSDYEWYWVNWVEPSRDFLLGWHQDSDHPDMGPAHLQVSHGGSPVEHRPAAFIDEHPMAVLDARLRQLPDALAGVEWDGETATGLDW